MTSSKDVAKMAGVSQATVSRVMNEPHKVKPVTRQKVIEAMKTLNYHPNLIARSLVTQSTKTIALIAGTLTNHFHVEITNTIVNMTNNYGYKTMVYFEEEVKKINNNYIRTIIENKADGILLSSVMWDDHLYAEIKSSSIPCLFINRRPKEGGDYVEINNQKAAEMITRYMIECGHTKIGYISGFANNISTFAYRKIGLEKVMQEEDIEMNPEWMHYIDTTTKQTEEATKKMMSSPAPPSCIICATDAMALDCMNTVMSLGYQVPEDISITGIDDVQFAAHQAIQLTTVGYDKQKMCQLAVNRLIDMIENGVYTDSRAQQIALEPELIIRKSTKHIPKT